MGAALLVEWAPTARASTAAFDGIVSAFPRRITSMAQRDHSQGSARVRVWSHPFARTPGLARDETTGSFLALIGNPAPAKRSPAEGDELLEHLLAECLREGVRAFDSV